MPSSYSYQVSNEFLPEAIKSLLRITYTAVPAHYQQKIYSSSWSRFTHCSGTTLPCTEIPAL